VRAGACETLAEREGAKDGRSRPLSSVRAISYRGELVAIATRSRAYLAPRIDALAPGDQVLRFVAAMCLYSHDVDEGRVPGPFKNSDAELYARCVLLPDEEFECHAHDRDDELARRLGVPVEQIVAKRRDLAEVRRP
jgi:hypothetical protein